jgi:Ferric reductase like transmembrane component
LSARRVRPGPKRQKRQTRPRGRPQATPVLLGWTLITLAVAIIGLTVALTAQGREIASAVQAFLLYYAGVFALLALTAAVVMGLAVTDRMVMTPASRVVGQAAHRILSLAALAALLTHIALEIIAHRADVADSVVPFLAHDKTFFIGLGTLASDLILLIVVTSIWRGRFTGRPQVWRVIHVTAYLAWLMSILHGLLGGRTAKPYVDWSYGMCFAAVAIALAVRILAAHRGRGHHQPLPVPERLAATSPLPTGVVLDAYRPGGLGTGGVGGVGGVGGAAFPRHRPIALNRPGPDDEYPPWR